MLQLQYFGHLMQRADSLQKTLMLRKIEGRRRRGKQRMRCLDSVTDVNGHESEQSCGSWGRTGKLSYYSPWGHEESDST